MDFLSIMIMFLPALVTAIITYWIKNSLYKSIDLEHQSNYVFKMHKSYLIFGLLSIFLGSFFFIGLFLESNTGLLIIILLGLILFLGLGILLFLIYQNHQVNLEEKKLNCITSTGKHVHIYYNEIVKVKLARQSGYLILKGKNKKVKVSTHLIGIKTLIEELKKKTSVDWKKISL